MMMAQVTTGNGGYDRIEYREVPVPDLKSGEVLIEVLAAGINNTDINTRIGWYSAEVTSGTGETQSTADSAAGNRSDGGWGEATPFPLIQGTDCCGRVVEVADDVDRGLLGKRVLVRPCIRNHGFDSMQNVWFGSDFDGAFAEYTKAPASEVFPLTCEWSDAELGSIPCSYGTAENLIHRSGVGVKDRVVITGASGGVGSAAVQLAKRRGAEVIAIAGAAKSAAVKAIGADRVVERGADLVETIGERTADVVIDIVGGDSFGEVVALLREGGRYATSGAIGGPIVSLDLRTLYLRDLTLIGATAWDEPVFGNLVSYIERGEIRPLLAKTFPLTRMAEAQQEFLGKTHVGKFVLIP
jgi:NADPH:quinone reductase-like Zn-dependent oxidoreductase